MNESAEYQSSADHDATSEKAQIDTAGVLTRIERQIQTVDAMLESTVKRFQHAMKLAKEIEDENWEAIQEAVTYDPDIIEGFLDEFRLDILHDLADSLRSAGGCFGGTISNRLYDVGNDLQEELNDAVDDFIAENL